VLSKFLFDISVGFTSVSNKKSDDVERVR